MRIDIANLAYPNSTLQRRSKKLVRHIIEAIQQEKTGSISFAQFMELALYEPQLGYYTGNLTKLGKAGDFVTAPEISPLFAQCMGNQCQQVFSDLGDAEILEIGAGTGKMACDLLLFLEKKGVLPVSYKILEISPNLKQRQQENLQAQIPHLFPLIEWLADWPKSPMKGVVIVNEVVDALPIHKFLWTNRGVQEMQVEQKKGNLLWCSQPVSYVLEKKLSQLKLTYFSEKKRYESEVCLGLSDWINKLSVVLKQGLILIADYGYPAREYYHPDRCHGTLMCYYRHRGYTNPFNLIGLQDITAAVDFSLLADCALNVGLKIAGFTSQAAFLLNNGLLQHVEEWYNYKVPSVGINQQIYSLTSPNEMGELSKVIGLTREYNSSRIQGFIQFDKRARL